MALSENPTLEEIIDEAERLNNLVIDRGGSKSITPQKSSQALPPGNYKGQIFIAGDSDLIESNIKNGVDIFGVIGNAKTFSMDNAYNYILYQNEQITISREKRDYYLLTTIKNNVGSASSLKIEFITKPFSNSYYMGYRLDHKRNGELIKSIDPGYQTDYYGIKITQIFNDFKQGDSIEVYGKAGNSNAYLEFFKAYIGIRIN